MNLDLSVQYIWGMPLNLAIIGITVPESSTVQQCLRLARCLLILMKNECPNSLISQIMNCQLVTEIHACILLVLTNGGLPRYLTSKFAQLYSILNWFMTSNDQFQLLNLIMGCDQGRTSSPNRFETSVPNLTNISHLVQQTLEGITITERQNFVRIVTRKAVGLNRLSDAIQSLTNKCERGKIK